MKNNKQKESQPVRDVAFGLLVFVTTFLTLFVLLGTAEWAETPADARSLRTTVSLDISTAIANPVRLSSVRSSFAIPGPAVEPKNEVAVEVMAEPSDDAVSTIPVPFDAPEPAGRQEAVDTATLTPVSGAGLFPRPAGGFNNVNFVLPQPESDEDGHPIRSVALLQDANFVPIPEAPPQRTTPQIGLFGHLIEPRSQIAIVIDDLGQDLSALGQILKLDPGLTLSFLPYGQNLQDQVDTARRLGHEVMLHMPMEPYGRDNPGPLALKASLSSVELDRLLALNFSRFTGYAGMNNHMGSLFTADYTRMRHVMARMKKQDIYFLDSRTGHDSSGKRAARDAGVPNIARDVFLDDSRSRRAIWRALDTLEAIARRRGWAVAIGHPYPETIGALRHWIADASERGFDLVPVSSLVYRNR